MAYFNFRLICYSPDDSASKYELRDRLTVVRSSMALEAFLLNCSRKQSICVSRLDSAIIRIMASILTTLHWHHGSRQTVKMGCLTSPIVNTNAQCSHNPHLLSKQTDEWRLCCVLTAPPMTAGSVMPSMTLFETVNYRTANTQLQSQRTSSALFSTF